MAPRLLADVGRHLPLVLVRERLQELLDLGRGHRADAVHEALPLVILGERQELQRQHSQVVRQHLQRAKAKLLRPVLRGGTQGTEQRQNASTRQALRRAHPAEPCGRL